MITKPKRKTHLFTHVLSEGHIELASTFQIKKKNSWRKKNTFSVKITIIKPKRNNPPIHACPIRGAHRVGLASPIAALFHIAEVSSNAGTHGALALLHAGRVGPTGVRHAGVLLPLGYFDCIGGWNALFLHLILTLLGVEIWYFYIFYEHLWSGVGTTGVRHAGVLLPLGYFDCEDKRGKIKGFALLHAGRVGTTGVRHAGVLLPLRYFDCIGGRNVIFVQLISTVVTVELCMSYPLHISIKERKLVNSESKENL